MSMDTARPRILLTATLVALAHAVPALGDCKGETEIPAAHGHALAGLALTIS